MTKPKYATPEARKAAASAAAKKQMREQWERQRQESGEPLGYFGCHRRVRAERGRAGDQTCVECGKPARHWAHIHDTDPTDVQNYQAMCQKCHFAYDGVGAKIVKAKGPEGCRQVALKAWETKRKQAADALDSPRPGSR